MACYGAAVTHERMGVRWGFNFGEMKEANEAVQPPASVAKLVGCNRVLARTLLEIPRPMAVSRMLCKFAQTERAKTAFTHKSLYRPPKPSHFKVAVNPNALPAFETR
jgi:hypothetical protein